MVVGGMVSKAAAKLRALVEERNGGDFADVYRADAAANGATRIDQDFESEVDVEFDDETYTGDAYPAFGWACAVAKVDVDLDTGEVRVRSVVSRRRRGPGDPPAAGRGPGRGRHAAVGRLRHHRGDEGARWALSQRPPGDVPHPHLHGRAGHHGHPRGGAVQRIAARRQGRRRATHERGCAPPSSTPSTTRSGSGSRSCPPPRSACWRPWRPASDGRSRWLGGTGHDLPLHAQR